MYEYSKQNITLLLGITCKLRQILLRYYNNLILHRLLYCMLSWGFKSDILFKLQKRTVQIITCINHNSYTIPLMKVPILLKIADIMKIKALKLCYRYQQNEFSRYFDSVFTETNDNHTHDTRHDFLY